MLYSGLSRCLLAILTLAGLLLAVPSSIANSPPPHADSLKNIRIVVMGDSLSAAYYIPLESGWVSLLQNRFDEKHMSVSVLNASISGATTAAGLQALPALLKKPTHIVILELGGNDGLQGKPVSLISDNLQSMIELSRNAGAKVLLLGMRLPPNLGARYTEPFYAQYATLAKKNRIPLVPFLLEGVAQNRALMQEDGIHPTAEAQPQILENVWPDILRLVKGIRAQKIGPSR